MLLCKQQGPFVGLNLLSLKGWQPWSVVPTKSEKKCGCQQTKPKYNTRLSFLLAALCVLLLTTTTTTKSVPVTWTMVSTLVKKHAHSKPRQQDPALGRQTCLSLLVAHVHHERAHSPPQANLFGAFAKHFVGARNVYKPGPFFREGTCS